MARNKFNIEHFALLSLIASFYLLLLLTPNKELEEQDEYKISIPPQDPIEPTTTVHDTFSTLLLKDEIKKCEILFPDIVYGQARLETGNFKSNYFLKRNNLFGFRVKTGYMYFRNWRECVAYYANWQKKYYKSGDYFEFLTKIGYAEADSIYKERVLACIK